MNINIYSKYQIFVTRTGSYIDQENSTPGDYSYAHFDDKNILVMSGEELISLLAEKMTAVDFSEINTSDGKIMIDFFDPLTGEACTIIYSIKELTD